MGEDETKKGEGERTTRGRLGV